MEGRFLQSLALLTAVDNPCQRREMAVSTNNGLVNGPVHNLFMQFFTLGSSKSEVFETCFYDIVTTQNDTCFSPYWGITSGGGGVSQGIGTQPAYAVFHPGQLKNGSF